jgi:hypothetical protein
MIKQTMDNTILRTDYGSVTQQNTQMYNKKSQTV